MNEGLIQNPMAGGSRCIFRVLVMCLVFGLCPVGWSQTKRDGPVIIPGKPVFDEPDSTARTQQDRIRALIESSQADEAIELLRQVIDAHGEKIVAGYQEQLPQLASFEHFVSVRQRSTAQLGQLRFRFPQEFAAYRRQLDDVAEQWLKQGLANRDEAILRRVIQEMFLSSAGDEALLALGEFALERGEYNAARNYWERIHPSLRYVVSQDPQLQARWDRPFWLALRGIDQARVWPTISLELTASHTPIAADLGIKFGHLVYPDTNLNLADVRARLALVSILEGNRERASIEVALLRRIAPNEQGTIGGRAGNLGDLLERFHAESQSWSDERRPGDWRTYAGDASRQHVADFELLDPTKPLWTLGLPRVAYRNELLTANRMRVSERSEGILAYHPLIVGDRVVVQAGELRNQVVVCDRETGIVLPPAAKAAADPEPSDSGQGVFGVPRFSSTAVDDLLFVRTGSPLALAPGNRARVARPARLDALSLSADAKLMWEFSPQGPTWGDDWTLGGAPVSDGKQLYLALIRRAPLRIETHVTAVDLLDGRVRWRKFLSAAEAAFDDTISLRTHTLLTLSQGTLYCNTNQGVVAACDATTGAIDWMTSYPRTALVRSDPDRNDLHFYRDVNPCLVFEDLVIVAPMDCNRLFALDANSGIPVWVTQAESCGDVVHFLGVGGNNLFASGECLYWLDVRTGRLLGQFPSPFLPPPGFARPSPRGYGRGILVGSHVYWPTYESIFVFEQGLVRGARGWEPIPVREILLADRGVTGGNLVAAHNVLLIAGADQLAAFRTVSSAAKEPQENGIGRRPSSRSQAQ